MGFKYICVNYVFIAMWIQVTSIHCLLYGIGFHLTSINYHLLITFSFIRPIFAQFELTSRAVWILVKRSSS